MTEAEWNSCSDPVVLLRYMGERPTERQSRLIACGCARRIERLCNSAASSLAIVTAEQYADGLISVTELAEAEQAARQSSAIAVREAHGVWAQGPSAMTARNAWVTVWARSAAENTCDRNVYEVHSGSQQEGVEQNLAVRTAHVASWAQSVAHGLNDEPPGCAPETDVELFFSFLRGLKTMVQRIEEAICGGSETCESVIQARLVRDILGNPFRPSSFQFKEEWKQANDYLVQRLAFDAYTYDQLDMLPIVGDAAEDAGCDNAELLRHLRGPGPHLKGCWALDRILGYDKIV